MIPQCIDQGVGVIPWSPLARGFLTGTRTREGERRTTRAETDAFQDSALRPPGGLRRHRPPQRGGGRALRLRRRRWRSRGCCTSRASPRRSSAPPSSSTSRRPSPAANLSLSSRGDRAPRGALRAPPGARARVAARGGPGAQPAGDLGRAVQRVLPARLRRRGGATPMPARRPSGRRGWRPARPAVTCSTCPAATAGTRSRWRARATASPGSTTRRRCSPRPGAGPATRAPDLVEADYRELPFAEHSFDAALNLFTSLGFHGDEEDAKALADIGRVLRPSGRLVIEIMHRDLAVRGFREQDWRLLGEGRLLLEQRTFDAAAGIAQTTQTLIDKDGAARLAHVLGPRLHGDRARGHADGAPASATSAATATSTAARSTPRRAWSSSPGADRDRRSHRPLGRGRSRRCWSSWWATRR